MDSANYYSFKDFRDALKEKSAFKLPDCDISLGIDTHLNILVQNCENNRSNNDRDDNFYMDQYPYKKVKVTMSYFNLRLFFIARMEIKSMLPIRITWTFGR